MDKKIIVLPRYKFEIFYSSLSEKQRSEIAFISIRDIEYPLIDEDKSNFLNLSFDDVEYKTANDNVTILFDEIMARQIIDFAANNSEKNLFVVHCLMGVSRSGAVGAFLSDYFGIKYEDFKRTNPQIIPNYLVSKLLKLLNDTI